MDGVNAALDAKDWNGAITEVLEVWRSCRAPELERALNTLSDWAGSALEPLPESDFMDAWKALARHRRPLDVPRLIARLLAPPANTYKERLEAAAAFGPDPRFGPVYLAMIADPPTTSSSNFGAWSTMFGHLPHCVDARAKADLETWANRASNASGFWPKLQKWCAKAASQVKPPSVLPADLVGPVAALQARLDGLVAGSVPTVAEPPPAPAAGESVAAPAGAGDDPLQGAIAALKARDPAVALDLLVHTWGTWRDPDLADAIEALDALLGDPAPLTAPTPKKLHALWMERGEHPRPSEVGGLLATADNGSSSEREARLELMLHWAPDPRVPQHLERVFTDYAIGARRRFWAAVQDNLVHHADPRRRADFDRREARYAEPGPLNRYMEVRKHIRRTSAAFHEAVAAARPLSGPERAGFDAYMDAFRAYARGAEQAEGDRQAQEAALVEAILAAPDEDGPRLVYADWLAEQGDPRGEFITLDVQLAQGRKVQGKRDKALKQHQTLIYGPLKSRPGRGRPDIDRGLVVNAGFDARKLAGLSQVEHDAALRDHRWAFVTDLYADGSEAAVLYRVAPLRSLVRVRLGLDGVAGLVGRSEPLPIRELDVGGSSPPDDAWEPFDRIHLVAPELETMHVLTWARGGGRVVPPASFFASPVMASVQWLQSGAESVGGRLNPMEWLNRMVAAHSPLRELRLEGPELAITARLRPDRTYDVAVACRRMRWPHQIDDEVADVASLRGPSIASLSLGFDASVTPECEERIRSALP
ncbi:MAG: TIGR02996 domain-containing protein [Myxococcota bacterium]